jgi:[lysine-biosynthesis-protein LysW]--L-2-aminoadipate ligase
MRIAVVYDVLRWEEKDIISNIRSLGHEPVPIHVTSFYLDPYSNTQYMNLDVVIQRCVSLFRAIETTVFFESLGIPIVNKLEVLMVTGDKLHTTMKLIANNIPTPRTLIAMSREAAVNAAKKLGFPVVVKPIIGSWGRMIAKVNDEDALNSILELREHLQAPYHRIHYIQEYIEKPGRDIRVFTVGNEIPAAIYRISNYWKTNTALGGRAECVKVCDELRDLVLKAAEAVGGGYLGIDVLEDPSRGYLINEVNGVTEYKNTVRVCKVNISELIIKYAIEVGKK